VTLFVPGSYASVGELAARLGGSFRVSADETSLEGDSFTSRLEWEDNPHDGSFGRAFSFGTCSHREIRTIDAARGAVVLHLPVELHTFRAEIAALASALQAAGALAFRIEQSKLGFTAEAWLARVRAQEPIALLRLAVVTLTSAGAARTLGMHTFSLPDVEIEASGSEASQWLDVMTLFQIDEDPVFGSGHTFAPDSETPRRLMEWWPDTAYPRGHLCHNPFGLFRLGAPGGRGRPQSKLRPTFIPPLVVLLEAARQQKGSPLTAEEVEKLRDGAACIAMDPRHARELERTRGYADLDPDRAAECWRAIEGGSS
jgi:hypothetical protein